MKEKCELVQAVKTFWSSHKVFFHQACAFLGIA